MEKLKTFFTREIRGWGQTLDKEYNKWLADNPVKVIERKVIGSSKGDDVSVGLLIFYEETPKTP